ncbi:MAG: hypothetical protein P8P36_07920 [Akkermansiaceae bacterium]|nr:hypothetical protein [Akkermansiaceae bacterium]
MRTAVQIVVIFVVLLVFGFAKYQHEDRLSRDMVSHKLIQPPLRDGTSLQLGQTGAAVALGGLRSLVAAIWNFRAFIHFEELNWIKVEEAYEVTTTLQPETTYYWETGAWHLHTNASSYFRENNDLSPYRRKSMQKRYIEKGSSFLELGITHNPDNWKLHRNLSRIWSDHHKIPDIKRAIKHFDNTLNCKSLPEFRRAQTQRFKYYAMTRLDTIQEETYRLGCELFKASTDNHLPKLSCTLFALQNALNIPQKERIPDSELFPNSEMQLAWLKHYIAAKKIGYPMNGVDLKIQQLETKALFKL